MYKNASILGLLSILLLVACNTTTRSTTTGLLARSEPTRAEIIRLAEEQLGDIEDATDWIIAATELAVAIGESNRRSPAQMLLEKAALVAATTDDPTQRATEISLVANAFLAIGDNDRALDLLSDAFHATNLIADESKRWDIVGKLTTVRAASGEAGKALKAANAMPVSNTTLQSYKERTLHEIAPIQAQQNELNAALHTLASITMGLPYYSAASRTDVAIIATEQERSDVAIRLLREADNIGSAQTDGYFVAGALRHVAVAHATIGNEETALQYFSAALTNARRGKTPQHQARAISRIAISLSDLQYFPRAVATLPGAVRIAKSESNDAFRYWAFYEIAGSAAFSGDFVTAKQLLELIPPTFAFGGKSLTASTQRDVAWGLARHNRVSDAVDLAMHIKSPRERVQSLSRIARLLDDPAMKALPRYL